MNYKNVKRICLLGSPGSGKSTLAKKLALITGYEHFHLDKHYHDAGWVPVPMNEFYDFVHDLSEQDCWIIDGNYRSTLAVRVQRADLIIFFDFNSIFSIYRIYKRIIKTKLFRKERDDIPEDCPENWFDKDFVMWTRNFRKRNRPEIIKLINEQNFSEDRLLIFKKVKDADEFLEKFSMEFESMT